MQYRIGQGYDFHKLIDERQFILGGVKISFDKGIEGHSDGDLLIHAIVDSILGGLSLGDIGTYFPSNNEEWENKDSSFFLKHAIELVESKNHFISNIDCTIILQNPQINQYIEAMKANLSELLKVSIDRISIKATTTDKLGFIGRGDGIGCMAICLLYANDEVH